jgi:hypothetical protein
MLLIGRGGRPEKCLGTRWKWGVVGEGGRWRVGIFCNFVEILRFLFFLFYVFYVCILSFEA